MLTLDSYNGIHCIPNSSMTRTPKIPQSSGAMDPMFSGRRLLPPKARSSRNSPIRREQVPQKHMWIVTGPAGCGKSTVAAYLSKELQLPYIEGDDYHPASNKEKMTKGIPLTDADRWDWLITLRDAAASAARASPTHTGVVVTCSALKRKYRDVIRVAAYNDHGISVHFLYLHASEQILMARVAARQGHFMGAAMVHSQFESLEVPGETEMRDVIAVDVTGPISDVKAYALDMVRDELQTEEEEQQQQQQQQQPQQVRPKSQEF